MNQLVEVLEKAVTGALIGYGTNWLAIRLLFRPYEKKSIGPFSIGPGVFVKHQKKLAREIAALAADTVLTEDSLRDKLGGEGLRDYFEVRLEQFFTEKLNEDFGALEEHLPSALHRDFRELVLFTRGRLVENSRIFLKSEAFASSFSTIVSDQLTNLRNKEVSSLVSSNDYATALSVLLKRILKAKATRELLENTVSAQLSALLASRKKLSEFLPPDVSQKLKENLTQTLMGELVVGIKQVDFSPLSAAVKKQLTLEVDSILNKDKGLLDRVASWTVKQFKKKQLDEGIERFALEFPNTFTTHLLAPENRQTLQNSAETVVIRLFQLSPAELVEKLGSEALNSVSSKVIDSINDVLLSERRIESVCESVKNALEQYGSKTFGELLAEDDEKKGEKLFALIGETTAKLVQTDESVDILLARGSRIFRNLVKKPIGRPDRFIPREVIISVSGLINGVMFDYLLANSAKVIQSLDIENTIEDKIANWSPKELHEIINKAARENLRSLEILGGVIGFVVGALSGLLGLFVY